MLSVEFAANDTYFLVMSSSPALRSNLKGAMQLLHLGSGLAVLGLPGTYLTLVDCPSHQFPINPIVPSDFCASKRYLAKTGPSSSLFASSINRQTGRQSEVTGAARLGQLT